MHAGGVDRGVGEARALDMVAVVEDEDVLIRRGGCDERNESRGRMMLRLGFVAYEIVEEQRGAKR